MLVRLSFTERADEGTRFAAGCFDQQIGGTVPVRVGAYPVGVATIRAVHIVDDGAAATFHCDVRVTAPIVPDADR